MRTAARAVALLLMAAALYVVQPAESAAAAGGALDPGFIDPQVGGQVFALERAPGGKIIVGGSFTSVGGQPRAKVARLMANGAVDPAFVPPPLTGGDVQVVLPLPDGRVLVAGGFTHAGLTPVPQLLRLRANGSIDAAWAGISIINGPVRALLRLPSGKILVGGGFNTVAGQPRANLVRLHPNGDLDTTFPSTVSGGMVNDMTRRTDGRLVIGGNFTAVGGQSRNGVARIHPNGSLDTTFVDPTVSDTVSTVESLPNGKVLIGGSFTSVGFGVSRQRVARLLPSGSPDLNFVDPGFTNPVLDLARLPDGRILAAGFFTSHSGGVEPDYLVRLERNGSVDTSFANANIADAVHEVVLLPSGKALVGGDFTEVNGVDRGHVARLTGVPLCDGKQVTVDLASGHQPTTGPDVIRGRPGNDTIVAKGGADRVCGLGGADVIRLGGGADRAFGGAGNDKVFGETGKDLLDGGAGGDHLNGGPQRDTCRGRGGTDSAHSCEVRTGIP